MRLKRLAVKNFRCIADAAIDINAVTALVGRNGAGKSTFLQALRVFYENDAASLSEDDFYGKDHTSPIEIELTWANLPEPAQIRFAKYIQNGELVVSYKIQMGTNGRCTGQFHGSLLRHTQFTAIRAIERAVDLRTQYNALRELPGYETLPAGTSKLVCVDAMNAWEEDNVDECERLADEGQFFGVNTVGEGYLKDFSVYVLVPAVRDASSDDDQGKGSSLTILIDKLVRETIASDEENAKILEEIRQLSLQIYGEGVHPLLEVIASNLSVRLRELVPSADLRLEWSKPPEATLSAPSARAILSEDEFEAGINRVGHGLQRAYVIALLQELADLRASGVEGEATAFPSILLAIEEPELYQHPNRQRHFFRVLNDLANYQEGQGIVQVAYTTHSPLFVNIESFDNVRLVRKITDADVAFSAVTTATMDSIAGQQWEIDGSPNEVYTGESLQTRLRNVMRPWINEGFFAHYLVLVEGGSDHAAMLGIAEVLGYDFQAHGVSVIPTDGKFNLIKCLLVFRAFGIPTFAVWDSDNGCKEDARQNTIDANRALLRFHEIEVEDFPALIGEDCCCFRENLNVSLREELGHDLFFELRDDVALEFSIELKRAEKNPRVLAEILRRAAAEGHTSQTLEELVRTVATNAGMV